MKIKRVNRYYCDFCKKAGCSKWHMERHEKHCTMNPNRICRYCKIMEVEQQKMDELLALLTKPEMVKNEYGVYYKPIIDIESEIEALRDITSNCPMCMFSAIRQKGIPIYMT